MNNWEELRTILAQKTKCEPSLFDLIAVQDILKLCVCGFSNRKISISLDFDQVYVIKCLVDFLGFQGWGTDLDCNLYQEYQRTGKDFRNFSVQIRMFYPLVAGDWLEEAFKICKRYEDIRKEIDNYYDKSA